jgi:hypothetical protein
VGKAEKKSIPLVRWTKIAMLKDMGGWDIKNLSRFGKALAAKSVWHFLQNHSLWGCVLKAKYLQGISKIDWI